MGLFDGGNPIAQGWGALNNATGGVLNVYDPKSGLYRHTLDNLIGGGQGGSPAAGGDPMSAAGQPHLSDYQSLQNADGTLKDPYKVQAGQMGNSDSWKALAMGQNQLNTQNSLDSANQGAASATADAQNQLAMNGGLSSGAGTYLAAQGQKNALLQGQDVRNQGNLNDLNIGLQAEQMNNDASKFNITNNLAAGQNNANMAANSNTGLNTHNLTDYQEQMKDFTGTKLADAYARAGAAGQKGGWGGLLDNLTGTISNIFG